MYSFFFKVDYEWTYGSCDIAYYWNARSMQYQMEYQMEYQVEYDWDINGIKMTSSLEIGYPSGSKVAGRFPNERTRHGKAIEMAEVPAICLIPGELTNQKWGFNRLSGFFCWKMSKLLWFLWWENRGFLSFMSDGLCISKIFKWWRQRLLFILDVHPWCR